MEDCNKDPCVRLFFAGCFLLLPRKKEKPDTRLRLRQHYKVHTYVISMEFSAVNRRRLSRETPLKPRVACVAWRLPIQALDLARSHCLNRQATQAKPRAKKDGCFRRLDKMQLFAMFKKIIQRGFRATLNFRKFKVALNPLRIIFLNFAKSCILLC